MNYSVYLYNYSIKINEELIKDTITSQYDILLPILKSEISIDNIPSELIKYGGDKLLGIMAP